jgi:hypothetical protein
MALVPPMFFPYFRNSARNSKLCIFLLAFQPRFDLYQCWQDVRIIATLDTLDDKQALVLNDSALSRTTEKEVFVVQRTRQVKESRV